MLPPHIDTIFDQVINFGQIDFCLFFVHFFASLISDLLGCRDPPVPFIN
jgi:hypothetical protein